MAFPGVYVGERGEAAEESGGEKEDKEEGYSGRVTAWIESNIVSYCFLFSFLSLLIRFLSLTAFSFPSLSLPEGSLVNKELDEGGDRKILFSWAESPDANPLG